MDERRVLALGTSLVIAFVAHSFDAAGGESLSQREVAPKDSFVMPDNAKPMVTPSQLARALFLPAEKERWEPGIVKFRGPALPLYPLVAPATVVVRTPSGHGAGVVVDASGWILTNHHCVAMARTDVATGAQMVQIHLGHMRDGLMELDATSLPALVHKVNEEKDLALVKLSRLPAGVTVLPTLDLAAESPVPGSDCVAVGHPAAGMLWTIRSCEVTNVGMWPDQQIDFIITRLQARSAEDENQLRELASRMPKIKILISSCGMNPGDSGGPLVNTHGDLIGITFAIPASNPWSGVTLDKFSYQVHVDDVAAFLAERPIEPLLHVPDPWPPASVSAVVDFDENGKPETMIFALGRNGPYTGLLIDLDENSLPEFSPEKARQEGDFQWDFEFGWQSYPEPRAFYDTDDDGEFDLILVDANSDDKADIELRLGDGAWVRKDPASREMLDVAFLPDAFRERFATILAKIPRGD